VRYDTIPDQIKDEDDDVEDVLEETLVFRPDYSRNLSILEKLRTSNIVDFNNKYLRCCNFKCSISFLMLTLFVVLAIYTPRLLFYGTNEDTMNRMKYDFIIVGGGPSGSLAARRLKDRGLNVLLLGYY
jgi:hypothetical protein